MSRCAVTDWRHRRGSASLYYNTSSSVRLSLRPNTISQCIQMCNQQMIWVLNFLCGIYQQASPALRSVVMWWINTLQTSLWCGVRKRFVSVNNFSCQCIFCPGITSNLVSSERWEHLANRGQRNQTEPLEFSLFTCCQSVELPNKWIQSGHWVFLFVCLPMNSYVIRLSEGLSDWHVDKWKKITSWEASAEPRIKKISLTCSIIL